MRNEGMASCAVHLLPLEHLLSRIRAIFNCCRRSLRRARHRDAGQGRALPRPASCAPKQFRRRRARATGYSCDAEAIRGRMGGIQKFWPSEKPCYPPAPCRPRIVSHLEEKHCRSCSRAWRLPPNCSAQTRLLQYRHSRRRNLRRCLWCVHDKIICSFALTSMAGRPGCAWTVGRR